MNLGVMYRSLLLAIFLSAISVPTHVLGWGAVGHEVICQIAFEELTPPARAKVMALIKRDDEYRLFAKSCSWPDKPRRRPKEHYVNLSRDAAAFQHRPCPVAEKCVVSAVLEDMASLALAGDEDGQLRALKGLAHWIGDLHQPMHVSFHDDRGANKIGVGAPCRSNLHAVWDGCIIKEKIGTEAQKIAAELRGEILAEDRVNWIPAHVDTIAVIGWANESFQIALQPEARYCVNKEGACWYSSEQREYNPELPQKKIVADDAYLGEHAPIVRERMKMAGVRLGSILNTIFKDAVVAEAPPALDDAARVSLEDFNRLSQRIEQLEDTVRALEQHLQQARDRREARQE